VFSKLGQGVVLLFFLLVLSTLLVKSKVRILTEDHHIIFLFYSISFISFAAVASFYMVFSDSSYLEFYPQIFGRMVNISCYFFIFLFIINQINQKRLPSKILLRAYLTGCYILLFFGIWQILNMLFNLPYPNFDTRSYVHSIDKTALLPFLKLRITSIAQEPAYLIPYLIDAIIILFYTSKKYMPIILLIIVLFFTLSLSGYMNMLLVMITAIFFSSKKNVLFFTVPILLCSISVVYLFKDMLLLIFQRIHPSVLLLSDRGQEIFLPINHMFSAASLFNILFGYGPKGIAYVNSFTTYVAGWREGIPLQTPTTHVLFADFLIDFGIIGFLVIIILFCYLFALSTKYYNKTKNRLGQVLCLNLVITSLYTSDYASPRFTCILILLLCLYKDAKNSSETSDIKGAIT
jgi:hypothetical protein